MQSLIQTIRRTPSTPKRATINGQSITVEPGETLLGAALREGIDFPHSCRVGACANCKCRVKSGEVRELTETGYILSADEIAERTVLACQSVPQTDLEIEVDIPVDAAIGGTVLAATKLTHDITRVEIQADRPIAYKAGQYTLLSMDGLDGVTRSYSFASAPTADGRVEFFIRHVPGGAFSSVVQFEDIVGRRVVLRGAEGEFWLRESEAPMVLVAGGSGLAPILALLEDAAERGVARSVTLLFGARTKRDLYALDRINALVDRWQGEFTYIPVLSEASEADAWEGAEGMVTELIARSSPAGAHAYLCGPPAMVDAGTLELEALGIDSTNIHADRFTSAADGAQPKPELDLGPLPSTERRAANTFDYLKFFGFHVVGLAAFGFLLAGGQAIVAGLLGVIAAYVFGDALLGDDTDTPEYRAPQILTWQLWMALPLLSLICFVSVWGVCSTDVLGFGAFMTELTGYDVLAAREATSFGQHVAGVIVTGLMIGMLGTIPAHELTHRTWDRISMFVGRGLLAFSFDTVFSIEHVYGHHRYVSTTHDPATAPRGRNVYWHVLVSTVRSNISAWKIEVERLGRRGHGVFSVHNAVIRGHLLSLGLVGLAWAMGGATATAYFVACMLWGKALLEIVNYMEHYGLVRNPEVPVQPRHSWNTTKRMSSWTLFNLTRHSHHHAQGEVPYQDLRPFPDAPQMISGYLSTILVAMVPPLWHYLMIPKLVEWDQNFANEEERHMAREANANSGIAVLMRRAQG